MVKRTDSRVPVTRMETQRALIDGSIYQEITFARLCTAFALLALAIACVGLYGTISYGVARRTSEIGIRMALGGRRATVTWMVLREVVALAAIGLAISVLAALRRVEAGRIISLRDEANDPLAPAAAVLTMAAATALPNTAVWQLQLREVVVDARHRVRSEAVGEDRVVGRASERLAVNVAR